MQYWPNQWRHGVKRWAWNLWVRLVCWDVLPVLFHHGRIQVVQTFGDSRVQKLRCDRCGRFFAINHQEQAVLPWDEDFERFYCEMYGLPRTNR